MENVANTVAIGHSEHSESHSEVTEENLVHSSEIAGKETLSTNPNESFKLHQSVNVTSSTPHRHNPFSKALSLKKEFNVKEKLFPVSHKQEGTKPCGSVISLKRKSLSLRKRKHNVSTQNYDESNKVCSKTHAREDSSQRESKTKSTLPRCASIANYQQLSNDGMLIIYPEDEDMMKGYSMDTEITPLLETPKECASCYVSTPRSHTKPLSCFELPKTPTFSPTFSPHMLRSSLAETLSANKSISLFSPPSQLEQSVSWSPRSEQKKAKRALFPYNGLAENHIESSAGSNKEYSFGNDVNLSEFLNSFEAMSETTNVINRYLVLEVVTQTSTKVYDNGRLALTFNRACIKLKHCNVQIQTRIASKII